ncbi:hypothetical protein G6009_01020 [Dietzia sp. SLG510A3-30A2]|nr:hypothetical protein [Dietzia sp. SLG510A3-30A2]
MTASLAAAMAADWPTYPARKANTVTMQQLAAEAAELRPGGALVAATFLAGGWQIDIHVEIPEARHHCYRWDDVDNFGVISVKADTFDAAVAEAMRRVEAAIADTPAHIIAY